MIRSNMLSAVFMALMTQMLGCGPSALTPVANSPVKGLFVQVQELDASKAIVRDYSDPIQPYGLQTSQAIVEALQEAGINAELATTGTPLRGQVIVEGMITLIEGGDTTSRVLLGGFGPVGTTRFGVAGKARVPMAHWLASSLLIGSHGSTSGGRALTDFSHAQQESSATTLRR